MGWFYFLCILKKFKYIIRFNIYFFIGSTISLVNIRRTTHINVTNSWENHVSFSFIKCYTLNIFWLFLSEYICSIVTRTIRDNWYFFFSQCTNKFSLVPTGLETLWNSFGLCKMMFSKLAASYISPVSMLFVLFLRHVFKTCVFDIYLLLCYVMVTYIHHHLRERGRYIGGSRNWSGAYRFYCFEEIDLLFIFADGVTNWSLFLDVIDW